MNAPQDRKPRILVVDDMPENIHVLMETLGRDYRFIPAKSGEIALQKAEADPPPDLILLDIEMPVLNGYEVLERVKRNRRARSVPVIFITAKSGAGDEARGFQLGAVDYITKPFVPEIVRARVRTHIELKRKTDLLEALAATDGLTGLYNRQKIDRLLDIEWRRAGRLRDACLSVALVDIDHFKRYNDHYGHPTGDDCLRQVAASLRSVLLRPSDAMGRYGGEEFIAVLPNTDGAGARHIGARMVEAVASLRIPHAASNTAPFVTVSAGVATMRPASDPSATLKLLENADRMLYQAKAGGRNRCAATHEGSV